MKIYLVTGRYFFLSFFSFYFSPPSFSFSGSRALFIHIFSSLFFFRVSDLPKFGEPLQNITVPVGREALLSCVVDNLQTYKVIETQFFFWLFFFFAGRCGGFWMRVFPSWGAGKTKWRVSCASWSIFGHALIVIHGNHLNDIERVKMKQAI